jgi:hypothetical protein
MDSKDRAMRGWLADPPPPPRTYAPGEEHKWYKMMGAAHLLPAGRPRSASPPPICEEPSGVPNQR